MNASPRRAALAAVAALALCGFGLRAQACTPHVSGGNGSPRVTTVPGVKGDAETTARECLQQYGYAPQRGGEEASKRPKGTVTRTEPGEGGLPIQAGAEIFTPVVVTYWLSNGQREVPDLSGMSPGFAQARLAFAGFALGTTRQQPASGSPDRVIDQQPKPGALAEQGSAIDIVVSRAYPEVPQVSGLTEADAVARIHAADLLPTSAGQRDSPQPGGIVLYTRPEAGTQLAPQSQVSYWTTSGQYIVPDLRRHSPDEARSLLANAGFDLGRTDNRPDAGASGRVLEQSPDAGTRAPLGQSVDIVVSSEYPLVPNVVGRPQDEAKTLLRSDGFLAHAAGNETSPQAADTVLRTRPAAGQHAAPGTSVDIWMASGENVVPDLTGTTRQEATARAEDAGFRLGQISLDFRPDSTGRVLRQDPAAGARLALGSPIDATLASSTQEPPPQSQPPPPVPIRLPSSPAEFVPDVRGYTIADATDALAKAGLSLGTVGTAYSREAIGRVINQSPAGGSLIAQLGSTTVTVVVGKSPWPPVIVSTVVLVLVCMVVLWVTQLRPWPWHWPPLVTAKAWLETPDIDSPPPSPAHDRTLDIGIRIRLEPGETHLPEPLPIVVKENPDA